MAHYDPHKISQQEMERLIDECIKRQKQAELDKKAAKRSKEHEETMMNQMDEVKANKPNQAEIDEAHSKRDISI